MTTHPSLLAGDTQNALILARLQASPGEYVPMPELAAVSSAYAVHSRISDLRRAGWPIGKPRLTRRGRTVCSSYQLERQPNVRTELPAPDSDGGSRKEQSK